MTSSQIKKQAVLFAEKDIPEQEQKNVVAKAGYDVISVSSESYEKFNKGFLLAELMHPKMMEEKMHDTVKNGYLLGRC